MTEKTCITCGVTKPIDDYYKHRGMADGHLNKCKECQKANSLAAKRANPEKYREISRKYANKEEVKLKNKIKRGTEKGKEQARKAFINYIEKYPKKYKAVKALHRAVKSGVILRPSICSECGKEGKIHAHHDNYNYPLVVRWLCDRCHKDWHIENEAIY